jgi:hypothetical protein
MFLAIPTGSTDPPLLTPKVPISGQCAQVDKLKHCSSGGDDDDDDDDEGFDRKNYDCTSLCSLLPLHPHHHTSLLPPSIHLLLAI